MGSALSVEAWMYWDAQAERRGRAVMHVSDIVKWLNDGVRTSGSFPLALVFLLAFPFFFPLRNLGRGTSRKDVA